MSTLNVSNISDGTTTVGTSYVVNGSAKAWVNFRGSDTFGIDNSFGVSSCDDDGVGDYSVNVTSAFSTDGFSSTSSCQGDSSNDNRGCCTDNNGTSETRVNTFICTSGAASDSAEVHVTIHGDLA